MSTVGDNRAAGESKAVETWLEVLGAVEAEPTRRGGRVVECGGLETIISVPFALWVSGGISAASMGGSS